MEETAHRAIAIVAIGAILPDAPNVEAFLGNITSGRYSISDVTPDRWDPALYYDPNPKAPEKTYSKIGGWVRDWEWDPLRWGLPIPPRVVEAMDDGQKWAVACTRQALADFGYPKRPLDPERTAVILGNAMAGEKHYLTGLRIYFPEYAAELAAAPAFAALPDAIRRAIADELHHGIEERFPTITEDTMPGELSNCIAGRIANLFNFHGPNYVVDAACASAMAAMSAAIEGLTEGDFDAVLTGGIDRNMGPTAFVKFCKIGALSATGTRPYADGADGFVMGEGAVMFLLKRLADAERDGDAIYAVLRGIGGSSDGKGKGITAPNPIGQRLAIQRAWQNAGLSPATASLVEGHGTSTRVGDVVEVESLSAVFGEAGAAPGSIALGSVKSNIGHLKAAAGAAGILKTVLALHHKTLPPSLHFEKPNPSIDFARSPFTVNTALRPWEKSNGEIRRAGVSAFGFGGTNFHVILEEHVPGRLTSKPSPRSAWSGESRHAPRPVTPAPRPPLRGALVIGDVSDEAIAQRLEAVQRDAAAGQAPPPAPPAQRDLRAPLRVAIDFGSAADLADKAGKALKALAARNAGMWKALRAQGIFRGAGAPPKVAFLYTGQGSQYANMLQRLREIDPIVAETFAEADRVMTPLLGRPLSHYLFVDGNDAAAVAKAEDDLRQTAITQPAVLATDVALTRLLAAHGVQPDLVMGHSLGEYGALVAAAALPFADALEAVSARGREMSTLAVEDNGMMAAVFAPLAEVERVLAAVDGYVVIANVNSHSQSVIGGASDAVQRAMEAFVAAGHNAVALPVSHAFHTAIVAPASEPLRRTLERLRLAPPSVPIVANVNGELYPMGPDAVAQMLDLLARQVASPVQFVKGLHTLYDAGARIFVEVGPKKALQGFVDDVFGERSDVVSLFTNHPKVGDVASFNQALCGLYAAGLGAGAVAHDVAEPPVSAAVISATAPAAVPAPAARPPAATDQYTELGRLFAEVLERGWQIYRGQAAPAASASAPVVISGAALGLPGTERIFADGNLARILHGESFIDVIPTRYRRAMLDKHITRLVKSADGGPRFETITDPGEVIKLAARGGAFDLGAEFGVAAERLPALDACTRLAIAAGIEALRDAGIPLVMHYRTTSKGTFLPERWMLPDALRDDTGVIFASAFPGYDALVDEVTRYQVDHARREQLVTLEHLRARLVQCHGSEEVLGDLDEHIHELRATLEREPYAFDRRFLFRILAMGHSQFAELIGARGPNTQLNAACASTTQAIAVAEDWIRAGRCRRVIVIAADDVTSDNLIEWIGAGFLASGAAATDEVAEEAALPFDRRRHGMLLGMGAAAIVVESDDAVRERGLRPICEVLSAVTANSAFHGTRLDVEHICQVMERLVAAAEARAGVDRHAMAAQTVFVSHETYTPARGGSASAEVHALRTVFGADADRIVVANTKGFTGHPMGVGIEDVVAIKALETGIVPPVANFREVDPELGALNLSQGGHYPVEYALRLGAGFGSQISMTLIRRASGPNGGRPMPDALGYAYRIADRVAWQAWLDRVSGASGAVLEVVDRTLRVQDRGPTAHPVISTDARSASTPPAPAAAPPVRSPAIAAPAAELVSPPAAAPSAKSDAVKERILELVAAKTGYPPDMLAADLDLEADLGIDTVKQAEMFAAIREAYGIPRDDKLKLRDFPTLAHVVQFVYDRRPDLAAPSAAPASPASAPAPAAPAPAAAAPSTTAPAAPAPQAAPPTAPSSAADPVLERVLALVGEKTGYPTDMLDPALDLEADLGIDTVKQAEMFAVIREAYGIARDDKLKLRDFPTLAHVVQFVYDRWPDLAAPTAPAPAAPSSPSPAPTAAAQASAADPVLERVLSLVAEKTGYPTDMLDPNLDLEADLGIDTVKQAEMFATIREAYGIPRDDKLKLRDFPTLAHVVQFVYDRRPDLAAATAPAPSGTAAPEAAGPSAAEAAGTAPVDETFSRRVPVPVLRPPLEACKPTGVTLSSESRVLIMSDTGGVAAALAKRLKKFGVAALVLKPAVDAEKLADRVSTWAAEGAMTGVYWLPALDVEPPLEKMELADWREALHLRVKLLYRTMRALYEKVAAPNTFLVSATRMGGQHGYDAAGASAPLGGAVSGLTKTFKRERPEALVKVVDFAPQRKPAEVAEALVAETLRDPGAVEIGHRDGLRWTIGLVPASPTDGLPGTPLGRDTVFVVTGAAGGIVSAITADLARAAGGVFYLLDKVPEPDEANPDLERFVRDREGLKRELFERLKARGERATPAMVERELAELERGRAALDAIRAVREAGGTVQYCSVDLTDAAAVARVMADVRARSGRIDVLLHAAGMEISHLLPDKEPREFDLVFDVKSDGWFNLLGGAGDMPIGAAVAFSSIAGRFGNGGQADYSAANDLLCKTVSSLRRTRPATRAVAIDWTAWAGIGMASRGSIPKMMELAGIDMLPPELGIPVVRQVLTAPIGAAEVVVAGRLGILVQEWDDRGGLDPAAPLPDRRGPMIGMPVRFSASDGLVIETTLAPREQPFLDDHRIDGTPVLPGVMGIEAFAELATLFLPGWHVASVEAVDFLAPFKFYRDEPRALQLGALLRSDGADIVADCVMRGSRVLPTQPEPQVTTHFRARVRLSSAAPAKAKSAPPNAPNGNAVSAPEIYRVYFHGAAYQVLERVWRDGATAVGLLRSELPPDHHPMEAPLLMAPRLIEACFQTAGLLELGTSGRMALPQRIGRVRVTNAAAGGPLYAVVSPRSGGSVDARVVDGTGQVLIEMEDYHTVELPGAVAAEHLRAIEALRA